MKKIVLLLLSVLFTMGIMAQNKRNSVSGVVVDEKGETLIGVSVVIKNNPGVGVKTDFNGNFKIKLPVGSVLSFSYVGYKKQEFQVLKDQANLKIVMKPADKLLEEVTVFGQRKQKKVSIAGAISSINVKELQTPATSINNMLGGRVAGIVSMQTSGEPGKDLSEFWVRGIGTFGVSKGALVLIDGLEGDLSMIDPTDVQSFSVLKDASATAVYGVRGANGVVLVTTKRGKEGRLQITGRANLTLSYLKRLPKYLRAYDYAVLANRATITTGIPQKYNDSELTLIKAGLDPNIYPDVDWQDEILRRASLKQTYYLNASGGGSIAKYFVSAGYMNKSAAYKQNPDSKFSDGVGEKRFTYRSNIDINMTSSTKVYLGLDGTINKVTRPGFNNTDQLWHLTRALTPLIFPTRYTTGEFPTSGKENTYSPYTMLNETGFSSESHTRNLVTLSIAQDLSSLIQGLNARVQVAADLKTWLKESRLLTPAMYTATGRRSNGDLQLSKTIFRKDVRYNRTTEMWRKYYMESQLNWTRDFGPHNVGALLYHYLSDEISTNINNYDKTGINNIPYRYQGLSGRLNYGYDNTYFIDLNFGLNGSENFPSGQQYGFFPSIALGWVMTEYDIMKDNLPWLSFLKVRGSYGTAGNAQISDARFPYLTKVKNGAGVGTTWGFDDSGIKIEQMGATNLRWETAIKTNIGFDGKLFKDRLSFTVDFFKDIRDDIFQRKLNVPDVAGFVSVPFGNIGSMYSYGTDGNISYYQKISKDMDFTIRGNYTYAANHVKHYDEAKNDYDYMNATGFPYGVQRGYVSLGLFKDEKDIATSPVQTFGKYRVGDIKYKDINGDGKINSNDKVPLAYSDKAPLLMYGFGGEFRYKNFTVSAMFRGTGKMDYFHMGNVRKKGDGRDYDYNVGWMPFYQGDQGNVLDMFKDEDLYWSKENPNLDAEFPRLSYGNNENNSQLSTFWKADGSYVRLSELNFSYKMNQRNIVKHLGVESVDFQLVGRNLFSIDKVKYFEPEQAKYNGGKYPIPAEYSLQIFVHF